MTFWAFQMSTNDPLFWILVIIAICFVVMALTIATLGFAVFRVIGIVQGLQTKIDPLIKSAGAISVQGKEIAEKFTQLSEHLTTTTKYVSDSAAIVKVELNDIKGLLGQTADTAKDKIALVNQTIERTNGQVKDTADFIQNSVVEPARELAAIMAGVRKGLEVLLAPTPKQLNRAYDDDEMFIG
ncbi:MAG: hypothetical protein H7Z37_18190 [Pyrinomonadaceae bacterium]|nr:hypothetical protein [Pyrinomonadaceae bacterium]